MTTTPGNTDPIDGHAPDEERQMQMAVEQDRPDPIAKYDDELRKVQGGWRDMDDPALEQIKKDGTPIILWVEPYTGKSHARYDYWWLESDRWAGWRGGKFHISFDRGPVGCFVPESSKVIAWRPTLSAPAEHPTEQPSVRDAVTILDGFWAGDYWTGVAHEDVAKIKEAFRVLRSLAQEGVG